MILGHKKQIELLENALQKGKLAHAYVFVGPRGVGKKGVARELGMKLLEERSERVDRSDNFFHPDLLEIDGRDGIKIEQIRELIYTLSLKPYQAKYKVAIIDQAENLTIEAANALLKSLEEPKPNTVIFLITNNPYSLPKTILSRCQKIIFAPVADKLEKSDESEKPETWLKIFQTGGLADKLILAYEIAELESVEITQMFEVWLDRLEQELISNPSKNLAEKIAKVLDAHKYLAQNVNTKLVLTNLMLNG
jgi:DNA polymerase III delta prime subunit